MTAPVAYLDPELDLVLWERRTVAAGMAFEKHFDRLRDRGRRPEESYDASGLADVLSLPELDPRVAAVVLHDPEARAAGPLVASARERIAIARVPAIARPPFPWGEEIAGWGRYLRAFRLPAELDPGAILARFGAADRNRLYLLGEPAAALQPWPRLDPRRESFHSLLSFVRSARWVLTSHSAFAGWVPYCVYTREDPRALSGLDAPEVIWVSDPVAPEAPALAGSDRPSFADVADAAALTDAEDVDLGSTRVVSVRALSDYRAMRGLSLFDCPFVHRGELSMLPQLERIDLRGVPMRDLTPLRPLPRLHTLVLDLRPRAGWKALDALPGLAHLKLQGIPDLDTAELSEHLGARALTLDPGYVGSRIALSPLSRARSLEALAVDADRVDLGGLDAFPALRALALRRAPLPESAPFERLRGLAVDTHNPLAALPAMPVLDRLDAEVRGLEGLERFQGLRHLGLMCMGDAPFRWDLLGGLRGLRSIVLGNFDDIPWALLASLPELTSLGLWGTAIDPAGLSSLEGLRRIEVQSSRLDLAPFAALANLEELVAHGCKAAENVEVLLCLPRLRRVVFDSFRLPDRVADELSARGVALRTHPLGWRPVIHEDLW
jgi:hypothetical protein